MIKRLSIHTCILGMFYDFDPLVEKLNSDKMIDTINFKINLKTKSMLGIEPCEKCQFIRLVNSIIKNKSILLF